MSEPLVLGGCQPEPLMGYLKALGVFRLVAEQVAPAVRMSWAGGVCRLSGLRDRDALVEFFLAKYRPTPILAPWNGGSGFYGGGSEPLDAVEGSASSRLAWYRDAIATLRDIVPASKPKDEEKRALLSRCRAVLHDDLVPWLDACFVLGEEKASPFPLLGTGGNDGRLDFTNNFLQRLADVVNLDGEGATAESACWLKAALFADTTAALEKAAVGQFNPGGIGGPNGVQGRFEADSRVNPWDFVLMIEGSLLLAGSVARRLGANAPTRSTFPFSVASVAVGYGSATTSEETTDGSRAELWLPLWDEPATLPEVRHLFAEGRAQLGRRQAGNAVEFALAVNLLGVARGIDAFARYGFLKRNGLAFLAAPLGRVPVTHRPNARLLEDARLADWYDGLRYACRDKDKTPARYLAALRQIDRAVFDFAVRSQTDDQGDPPALVSVLRALGRAERTLASGLRFCADKRLRPLQGLDPQWLDQANDKSAEFALAAALAGVEEARKPKSDQVVGALRAFIEPVRSDKGRYYKWDAGSTSAVWANRPLEDNLAAVFRRRLMEAFRAGLEGIPLSSARPAALGAVLRFLDGDTDDEKLADLAVALGCINWAGVGERDPDSADVAVPYEFAVTRLLVAPRRFEYRRRHWRPIPGEVAREEVNAIPTPEVFSTLAHDVGRGIDAAARRLKAGGLLVQGYGNRAGSGKRLAVVSAYPPSRLLAALLFPLSDGDLARVADVVLFHPEPDA